MEELTVNAADQKQSRPPEAQPPGTSNAPAWTGEIGQEPRGIDTGIADADKKTRTGSTEEPIRNTPPARAWNDTSAD
jgi:hypothetical protein